jgi:hypothetical protein
MRPAFFSLPADVTLGTLTIMFICVLILVRLARINKEGQMKSCRGYSTLSMLFAAFGASFLAIPAPFLRPDWLPAVPVLPMMLLVFGGFVAFGGWCGFALYRLPEDPLGDDT